MSDDIYLDGYVYHMVHINNLESILRKHALLSRDQVRSASIEYYSIAEEAVQDLRDRVYIWSFLERQWRSVHSYVPFYFAKHTPMLFTHKNIQHDIIFFELDRSILKIPGAVFTDGNVANQQLAKSSLEKVYIVPATAKNPLCRRQYSSGTPCGTNSNRSNVYADLKFLRNLNWVVINDRWFDDPEKKRIKHAEVLVPDTIPLGKIEGISALTQEKANAVNMLIKRCGLERRIPGATHKPDLYF